MSKKKPVGLGSFQLQQTVKGKGRQPVNRTIYVGKDNYDVLCGMDSGTVDLVAMDPPFNKNAPFIGRVKDPDLKALLRQNRAEKRRRGVKVEPAGSNVIKFKDYWSWNARWHEEWIVRLDTRPEYRGLQNLIRLAQHGHGKAMAAYVCFMSARCLEIRRVLKDDGVIFLHCDHTACHYIRAMMDIIFGSKNYQAQIVWKRTSAHSNSKAFGRVYDVLLFYGSRKVNVDDIRVPHDPEYVRDKYRHDDNDGRGRYRKDNLKAPDKNNGYRYRFMGQDGPWRHPLARMQELEDDGRISIVPGRVPELKRYWNEVKMRVLDDLWTDIKPINSQAAERTGWPTQKPLALYERIVKACSNEGDVVLDPFCGCATTCIAAERTGRHWIGMDIVTEAAVILQYRMGKEVTGKKAGDKVKPETRGKTGKRLFIRDYTELRERAVPRRTDDGEPALPYSTETGKKGQPPEEGVTTELEAMPARERKDKKIKLGEIQHEDDKRLAAKKQYRCELCGIRVPSLDLLQVDHVIPLKFYRQRKRVDRDVVHHITNLQLLCQKCNASKGPRFLYDDFI